MTLWSASGQRPASLLATLTNPSNLSVNSGANVKRFTAPPYTNLHPNTTYFVGPIKMRQFIFTHTSGPVPRHAVLGVGGVQ